MILPAELRATLVPFAQAVGAYFAMGGGAPSCGGAALKCAPVLCLMLSVLLAARRARGPRARYGRRVGAGLALSALGDALLAWPGARALAGGMGAFAAAHACYARAFGTRPLRARLAAPLLGGALLYARALDAPGALGALVPAYALLLGGMAWRGAARAGAARAGALLFLLSDAILGYSLFVAPVPGAQVLVMSTYYLGQLGIALSALQPPTPVPAPAGG